MEHTKGLWVVADTGDCLTIGGLDIGAVARIRNTVSGKPLTDEDRANAKRIVDCVNACNGMDDPLSEVASLRNQAGYKDRQLNRKTS